MSLALRLLHRAKTGASGAQHIETLCESENDKTSTHLRCRAAEGALSEGVNCDICG